MRFILVLYSWSRYEIHTYKFKLGFKFEIEREKNRESKRKRKEKWENDCWADSSTAAHFPFFPSAQPSSTRRRLYHWWSGPRGQGNTARLFTPNPPMCGPRSQSLNLSAHLPHWRVGPCDLLEPLSLFAPARMIFSVPLMPRWLAAIAHARRSLWSGWTGHLGL
jgi:hypothetical protein